METEGKEIKGLFSKYFNNQPNFMTPKVIKYGQTSNYLYELSEGRGLGNNKVYGVTVLSLSPIDKKIHHHKELSDCFFTLGQAITYVKELATLV